MWYWLVVHSYAFPWFSQIVEWSLDVIALWWSVILLLLVKVWDIDFYKVKRATKFPVLKTLILLALLTKHNLCMYLIRSIRRHCVVICWYLYCFRIDNLQFWNVTRNLCHIPREDSSRHLIVKKSKTLIVSVLKLRVVFWRIVLSTIVWTLHFILLMQNYLYLF